MPATRKILPTVDIGDLYRDTPESRSAVDRALGEACENFGAFLATGLPAQLKPDSARLEKRFAFFDLPRPVLDDLAKREMRADSTRCMRGYVDRRTGGFAFNEIFDIGPEKPASGPAIDGIELVTETNVWPSTEPAPNWREEMIAGFEQTEALGIRIIRALARYLQVDETAAAARYRNSSSSMRLLKYPGRPVDGQKQGLIGKEHTDNGGLTFQWQDQPGLQIRTPAGEWLDVPARSEGLSVHLGETLETQSSRKLAATPHRILGRNRVRHSVVFFLEPNLFASTGAFSKNSPDDVPTDEETYAASMINTLRKTGRA